MEKDKEQNKTIALFGGTGFVGSHMLQLLLRHSYSVRMLVRQESDMPKQEGLTLIVGSLPSAQAIAQTLEGADAVIVMTGPRSGSIEDMQTVVEGTRMIVQTMQDIGIKRLLKLSGVSVRLKGEPFPLPRRLLDIGLGIAMKYPSQSKYLEQDIIEASELDWTVVRPPVISKQDNGRRARAHDYAFLGMKISVQRLCEFVMEQLESTEWVRRSPTLG